MKLKLRKTGLIEGQNSRFSSLADLIAKEGEDYVAGYLRGAVAVARQIDPTGGLAERVRAACRLNLKDHETLAERVEADWASW